MKIKEFSLPVLEESLLSYGHNAETGKNQAHSFIPQVADLQDTLNSQPSTVLR